MKDNITAIPVIRAGAFHPELHSFLEELTASEIISVSLLKSHHRFNIGLVCRKEMVMRILI